jgi:hypothetical protein
MSSRRKSIINTNDSHSRPRQTVRSRVMVGDRPTLAHSSEPSPFEVHTGESDITPTIPSIKIETTEDFSLSNTFPGVNRDYKAVPRFRAPPPTETANSFEIKNNDFDPREGLMSPSYTLPSAPLLLASQDGSIRSLPNHQSNLSSPSKFPSNSDLLFHDKVSTRTGNPPPATEELQFPKPSRRRRTSPHFVPQFQPQMAHINQRTRNFEDPIASGPYCE